MLNVNRTTKNLIVIIAAFLACLQTVNPQTPVIKREGFARGFLIVKSLDGKILADGEQTQTTRGHQVTARTVFHFKDGSIQDETTVFSQQQHLKLISDHMIQKGPFFKESVDVSVTGAGQVNGKSTDSDGKEIAIRCTCEQVDSPLGRSGKHERARSAGWTLASLAHLIHAIASVPRQNLRQDSPVKGGRAKEARATAKVQYVRS